MTQSKLKRTQSYDYAQEYLLCVTRAEVPWKRYDITDIVQSQHGLQQPFKSESKPSVRESPKSPQVHVPGRQNTCREAHGLVEQCFILVALTICTDAVAQAYSGACVGMCTYIQLLTSHVLTGPDCLVMFDHQII